MRIISRFHDYYDSVQAHGQDDQIRFLRRAQLRAVTLPGLPWDAPALDRHGHGQGATGPLRVTAHIRHDDMRRPLWAPYAVDETDLNIERAYLLIGGQAHAVWVHCHGLSHASAADWNESRNPPTDWDLGPPVNWGDPSVRALAERWHTHRVAAQPKLAGHDIKFWRPNETEEEKLKWEQLTDTELPVARAWRAHEESHRALLDRDWSALHLELGSPVLLIKALARSVRSSAALGPTGNCWVLINPRLADLRWGARQDAYTVFQAISQFIGGVMPGSQAPLVTLQDRDQVRKKGFDPIYGFRTRPQDA